MTPSTHEKALQLAKIRDCENPYTITDPTTRKPMRVGFYRTDELMRACVRREKLPGDDPGKEATLDLALIQPGTLHDSGRSTDSQFLPGLAVNSGLLCNEMNYGFHVRSRPSWQCDLRGLMKPAPGDLKLSNRIADLHQWFPGLSVDECAKQMHENQAEVLADACDTLENYNLVVIGTPADNKVMAHLCDLLTTGEKLRPAELGMYLFPADSTSGLILRRFHQAADGQGRWVDYYGDHPPHRDIGWVHMIRNPWCNPARPRFLIYYGGFNAQGVQAAMRKRMQISNTLVSVREGIRNGNADAIRVRLRTNPSAHDCTDFQYLNGNDENSFIAAHIVKAKVKIPRYWFFKAPRPDGLTSSFEGNVKDYEAVTGPID